MKYSSKMMIIGQINKIEYKIQVKIINTKLNNNISKISLIIMIKKIQNTNILIIIWK